jgi:AcrR family transcriptional regulator
MGHRMSSSSPAPGTARVGDARERILETAYGLFWRLGFQAVGVDRISAEAGVGKRTLYRHFHSKAELVVAVLALHQQRWTEDWFQRQVDQRGSNPEARLLAVFDVFEEWFGRTDFASCLFINSLVESHDRASAIGSASAEHLESLRGFIRGLAEAAGIRDPEGFARRWQTLMAGSVVLATRGDENAALNARDVAELLLERELP